MKTGEKQPSATGGLPAGLAALVARAGEPARSRPVDRWNPPYCGEIDMRIAADGTWFYRGTPIGREALVRLFASILRREPDGRYVLVTPVERVGITVEDAAFRAVEVAVEGAGSDRTLTFRINVGDIVAAGPEHQLRFEAETGTGGLKPYLHVRGGLEALVTRSLSLDLVALGDERAGAAGIWSGGAFFAFPETALG
jgi:uncharacterized protein